MTYPFDYVSKGIELIGSGLYPAAEQMIFRGLREYEKQKDKFGIVFTLGRLGFCYEQSGQIDKAKETYEQAVSMGTNIPATYASLVTILVKSGEFDRAFQVANQWNKCELFLPSCQAEDIFIKSSRQTPPRGRNGEGARSIGKDNTLLFTRFTLTNIGLSVVCRDKFMRKQKILIKR